MLNLSRRLGFSLAILLIAFTVACAQGQASTQSSSQAGTQAGAQTLAFTPSPISFGSALIGGTAQQTVTIQNTSTTRMRLRSASVTGSSAFGVAWAPPVWLKSAGTYAFTVSFTPSAQTSYSGTLTINTDGGTFTTPVTGTGTSPATSVGIGVSPTSAALQVGGSQQFSATVSGTTNTSVTWAVNGVAGGSASTGTISASGLYTAPASLASTVTVTVTATSVADTTKSASASISVSPAPTPISVAVTPATASLTAGNTQQFSASVSGTSNTSVTWTASTGTISASGLYTAPASVASTTTVTVKATSVADTSKSASATVTVSPAPTPVSVAVTPATASLTAGNTQQFSASVSGTSNTSVTWTASTGTISASGLYTAPASVASTTTVTVKATSVADTTKSASATVSVSPQAQAVTVSVSPTSVSVGGGQTQQFTATVSGTTNTGITWQVNGVAGGNATTGTISSTGLYSAPACPSVSSVTITARSVADATAYANSSVSVSGGSTAAGYYVATTGSNSNSGTACAPWATIAYAATKVTAGSVVHVAPGTYNGQVFVSASGTSSAHIQFLCDSYRQCKVIGSNYNSSWGPGAFTFSGSYIDVQNFDITTDASGTHGVLGYGSAAGYNIVGNYIHDIPAPGCTSDGGAGIDPEGTSNTGAGHAYIADNLVVNIGPAGCNRTHGIYTSGDGDTIVNNIVHNAQGQCISAYHVPRNQVVAFNTLDGCKNGGIVYGSDGTNGIMSSGSVFVNNIITNNGGYGIQECCTAGYYSNNTYDHNLIYNSGSACIMLAGSCTNTSTSNPVFVTPGSDFHLQSTSPAIGTASTQAAPSVDYEGKTRTTPQDRGALRH